MINPFHIIKGWFYSLIFASATKKKLSKERLKECESCEEAVKSDMLTLVNGSFENVNCLRCTICGCPVLQKSLVKNEKCPKGKWKK